MKILIKIKEFILCLLSSNCIYSIKKLLSFFFTGLVFYLAVFTDKFEFFSMTIVFLGALLGLREYAKDKYYKSNQDK